MHDSNYLKSCRTSLCDYLIELLLGFYNPIRLMTIRIIVYNYNKLLFQNNGLRSTWNVYTYEESVSSIDDHGFVHPTISTSVSTYNPQKTDETCRRRDDQYVNLMV